MYFEFWLCIFVANKLHMQNSFSDFDFSGKIALMRVDFNVPLDEKKNITDATRIQAAKDSINTVLQSGGKVVLLTHFGRPKGKKSEEFSLQSLVPQLEEILGHSINFLEDPTSVNARKWIEDFPEKSLILCENIRFYPGEESGDDSFATQLAKLGDVYINDAFGTAHRRHASTAVLAEKFSKTKFFGLLMEKELHAIEKVLKEGKHPITAVIGGAKVSSKITVIENILPAIDHLIIGGGMAFTFIRANGGMVGKSMVEEDKIELAVDLMRKCETYNVKLHLPVDVIAASEFNNASETSEEDIMKIPFDKMGLDVGPKSRALFHDVILDSKTILWNGPLGVFEMPTFAKGTVALGDAIAEATALGAFSLVGGGDSVSFVKQFGYEDKVSYVSTGGGAMLESLEGKELPGVAAITAKN